MNRNTSPGAASTPSTGCIRRAKNAPRSWRSRSTPISAASRTASNTSKPSTITSTATPAPCTGTAPKSSTGINRGEQDRVIDTEIGMNDAVADGGHGRPRDIRVRRLDGVGQMANRLAHDLVTAHDGIAGFLIGQVRVERHPLGEADDRPAGCEDVLEEIPIVEGSLHTGTASRRM